MHHFGSEVRLAREAAGMSCEALADLVPCNKGTVSRIEAGLSMPDRRFAEVCSETFRNPWFVRFWSDAQSWKVAARFPVSLREFAAYEAEATTLWLCEHSVIPGLLQVEPYARAAFERHPDTTPEQAAEMASVRIARQDVLARDRPPRVWVLIDEQALYREVAEPPAMADQMRHLLDLAMRPNITVQLIPRKRTNVALSGAFAVAETPETTVAYFDHQVDATTTDSPATVAHLWARFDGLRTEAYRGTESLELIEKSVDTWQATSS